MTAADRVDELKKRYDENPRRFFASLANEYRKAGDLDQAISICEMHLAGQPGNMNGHVVYGQALYEAGRYDDSKKTFETALSLDPENLIALRHLGDIACTNGANDEAKVWYERVLDADPRNEEIIALLAHLANTAAQSGAVAAPSASLAAQDTVEIPAMPVSAASAPTPIRSATPVSATPITATPVSPTPVAPPPRQSIGLMDLAIDFDAGMGTTESITPAAPPAAENVESAAEEFPSFGDLDFGTQPEDTPKLELLPADDFANAFPDAPPMDAVSEELPANPAPPFVTETMAELYLQQGFTAEALDVYRQLSAQFPDDENLKERVRKLGRGDRTSLSLDVVEENVPEPEAPPAIHQQFEETARQFEDAPLEQLTAPIVAVARGVRAYFAGLASRRAMRPDRAVTPTAAVPSPQAQSAVEAQDSAPIAAVAASGSLDSLFGGAISQEDEFVALAFAQVAGAVEMKGSSVKGRPTAQAETELSLDSVFREADSKGATVPRQSQTLRFDQFFSTTDETADPSPPQQPTSGMPMGEPGSPGELKQFQSWLTGLKKP